MKKTDKAKEVLSKLIMTFEEGELVNIIAKRPIFIAKEAMKPSDTWSLMNQILQIANLTEDARGYKQWQKVGRQVIKGRRAFYISAPIVHKKKEINLETKEEEERRFVSGFRFIPVFRYEDTEGTPLSNTQEFTPKILPPLFDVATRLGVKVKYLPGKIGHRTAMVYGTFSPGKNQIRLYSQDDSVFFHELAHAAHATFRDVLKDSTEVETVAETVAAVLLVMHGQNFKSSVIAENWNYLVANNEGQPGKTLQTIGRVLNEIKQVLEIIFPKDITGKISPDLQAN